MLPVLNNHHRISFHFLGSCFYQSTVERHCIITDLTGCLSLWVSVCPSCYLFIPFFGHMSMPVAADVFFYWYSRDLRQMYGVNRYPSVVVIHNKGNGSFMNIQYNYMLKQGEFVTAVTQTMLLTLFPCKAVNLNSLRSVSKLD